jgi:hypothetical protein
MRRVALILAAAFAAACSKPETPPAAEAPPPPAPSIDLAALAGTWASQTTAEGSDSVLVSGTITASADAAGWTILLPGRDPIPMTVTVSGDSLLTSMGPFESVLRKGVQVTTTGTLRLVGGKLTGPMVAHYATTDADSVKRLWMTATRNP